MTDVVDNMVNLARMIANIGSNNYYQNDKPLKNANLNYQNFEVSDIIPFADSVHQITHIKSSDDDLSRFSSDDSFFKQEKSKKESDDFFSKVHSILNKGEKNSKTRNNKNFLTKDDLADIFEDKNFNEKKFYKSAEKNFRRGDKKVPRHLIPYWDNRTIVDCDKKQDCNCSLNTNSKINFVQLRKSQDFLWNGKRKNSKNNKKQSKQNVLICDCSSPKNFYQPTQNLNENLEFSKNFEIFCREERRRPSSSLNLENENKKTKNKETKNKIDLHNSIQKNLKHEDSNLNKFHHKNTIHENSNQNKSHHNDSTQNKSIRVYSNNNKSHHNDSAQNKSMHENSNHNKSHHNDSAQSKPFQKNSNQNKSHHNDSTQSKSMHVYSNNNKSHHNDSTQNKSIRVYSNNNKSHHNNSAQSKPFQKNSNQNKLQKNDSTQSISMHKNSDLNNSHQINLVKNKLILNDSTCDNSNQDNSIKVMTKNKKKIVKIKNKKINDPITNFDEYESNDSFEKNDKIHNHSTNKNELCLEEEEEEDSDSDSEEDQFHTYKYRNVKKMKINMNQLSDHFDPILEKLEFDDKISKEEKKDFDPIIANIDDQSIHDPKFYFKSHQKNRKLDELCTFDISEVQNKLFHRIRNPIIHNPNEFYIDESVIDDF